MNVRDGQELRRAARRLALRFTVLMLVVLALMGTVLYFIVASSTAESVNRSLIEATTVDSPRDVAPGVFVFSSGGEGREHQSAGPAGLPDHEAMARVAATGTQERGMANAGGREYRTLTMRRGGRIVQSAIDVHESTEALHRLGWGMMAAGAIATLLAAGLSVVMAQRAMAPMAASLALQRRFIADASHELRTPLTLLSTRAQLLHRKLGGTELQAAETAAEVSMIVRDAKLLEEILEDLLLSSDPRSTEEYSKIDLCQVARRAIELAEPGALDRGITLEQRIPTGTLMVRGSAVALLRVFTSAVSNALDYARGGVVVEVRARGSDALILVGDDGPGFPHGFSVSDLGRFSSTRAPARDLGAHRHYGLGLALVAEIAALHGGRVVLDSGPGGGALVTVHIPLARS